MSQKLNFVVLLLTTLKVIEGFYLPGVVPRQFLPDELVGKLSFRRNVASYRSRKKTSGTGQSELVEECTNTSSL